MPGSLLLAMLLVAAPGAGQEPVEADTASAGSAFAARAPLRVLSEEGKRYLQDSIALIEAPFGWRSSDWLKAGAVGAGVGVVMAFDERLAEEIQERRSPSTDRLSKVTTRFGSADAFYLSGGLVLSGLAFRNDNVTSMGREAIEASVFSVILASVSKAAFGRQRPVAAGDETIFRPGSANRSFPSGHATEAFTVASVVAARSSGWMVPVLAYTCASLVAFDRVNDRAHFPSDVVAGAVLGVSVGRFVVHRHVPRPEKSGGLEMQIVPVPHGVGVIAHF